MYSIRISNKKEIYKIADVYKEENIHKIIEEFEKQITLHHLSKLLNKYKNKKITHLFKIRVERKV